MSLEEQKCEACRVGAPKVEIDDAQELLQEIPGWKISMVNNISQLERTFEFDNFNQAIDFANRVAVLAETENHHPTLTIDWGKTKVVWWTHKIKGLHRNDFIMAARTNRLFA